MTGVGNDYQPEARLADRLSISAMQRGQVVLTGIRFRPRGITPKLFGDAVQGHRAVVEFDEVQKRSGTIGTAICGPGRVDVDQDSSVRNDLASRASFNDFQPSVSAEISSLREKAFQVGPFFDRSVDGQLKLGYEQFVENAVDAESTFSPFLCGVGLPVESVFRVFLADKIDSPSGGGIDKWKIGRRGTDGSRSQKSGLYQPGKLVLGCSLGSEEVVKTLLDLRAGGEAAVVDVLDDGRIMRQRTQPFPCRLSANRQRENEFGQFPCRRSCRSCCSCC